MNHNKKPPVFAFPFLAFGLFPTLLNSVLAQASDAPFSAYTPSTLETEETLLVLQHAFAAKLTEDGKIDEETHRKGLGFKSANAGLLLRSRVWAGLEVRVQASTRLLEYSAGFSYTSNQNMMNIMLGADSFVVFDKGEYRKNAYVFGSMSAEFLRSLRLVPAVGMGYDGFQDHAALVASALFPISEKHAFSGGYHARIKRQKRNPDIGEVDSWNVGYQYTTGGHLFGLFLSNSWAVNERQANFGSDDNDLNWAFRISRSL